MNNKPTLVSVCGVIVMTLALAGCSGGALTTSPADSGQQEAPSSADSGQPEIVPTVEPGQQEAPAPADSSQPEVLPTTDSVQLEDDSPASVVAQSPAPEIAAEPVTGPAPGRYAPRTGDGIDVVYFETAKPCGCMAKVGDAIEEAVLTYFQDELQSGALRYFLIVSNDPDNIDLVELFDSQPLELRIVTVKDGQMSSEPIDEIWSLKSSPSTLVEFVHKLVLSRLEGQQ